MRKSLRFDIELRPYYEKPSRWEKKKIYRKCRKKVKKELKEEILE